MASASPIAFVILVAIAGAVLLPLLWWFLAFWQNKCKLTGLSKLSVVLSIMPIISVLALYYGEDISAKYSVILFSVTPFINFLLLLILLGLTVFKVRSKNDL